MGCEDKKIPRRLAGDVLVSYVKLNLKVEYCFAQRLLQGTYLSNGICQTCRLATSPFQMAMHHQTSDQPLPFPLVLALMRESISTHQAEVQ